MLTPNLIYENVSMRKRFLEKNKNKLHTIGSGIDTHHNVTILHYALLSHSK